MLKLNCNYLEAIKELETLYEPAVKYEVSPVIISRWKKEFIENSAAAFEAPKVDDAGILYSVGMLSDVHIGVDTAEEDFARALNFFNSTINAEFTCICGDITENATETEYASYKSIVDAHSPSRPVHTTTGNHDAKGDGVNETLWKQYTGHDITFEVSRTLAYF